MIVDNRTRKILPIKLSLENIEKLTPLFHTKIILKNGRGDDIGKKLGYISL